MSTSERWKVLAALTFTRSSMGFQFQSVASLAPFINAELGMDKAQLGWLIGLYLLPGAVIAVPGGVLGVRYGDKRVTVVGLLLMVGGGLWLSFATTFLEANAARVLSGIGAVILNVLLTKMTADWFSGKERLLAMAVLVNSWPVGIGLALLALGPFGEIAGWRWAASSTAIFAFCGLCAILVAYRTPVGPVEPGPANVGLRLLTKYEWRLLLIASLPWMLFNAAYQIVVSFLPSLFLERGLSISHSGAMVALNTVLIVASVQIGGFVLKHSRRPDVVIHVTIAAWAITLFLLSAAPLPLLWIVLGGLVAGMPAGALIALPAEFLRSESRSVGMGIFYTVYYVGCAVLPSIAGALYDASGSAQVALWMAGLLALGCVPTVLLFRQTMSREQGLRFRT